MATSMARLNHPEFPPSPAQPEDRWRRVLARDPQADFVYAVRTTGIYCRPSCTSRRPKPENVAFFATGEQARAAGFRACLRCSPGTQQADAALANRLVRYLRAHLDRSVPLAELAQLAGRTPANTQRLFTRVMGLSPRAFQRQARAEVFRQELSQPQARITDAIYEAGFSGPSRAHAAAPLGMEARQYRSGAPAQRITFATAACPLGTVLVAFTARGVCAVLLGEGDDELATELGRRFPRAEIVPAPATEMEQALGAVQAAMSEHSAALDLSLDLRATAFQARVWEALRAIPRGETRTYSQVAEAIGAPTAVRAVAAACAANPAALLVPCHRVIGADGKLTGYRWGIERKRRLLALEKAAPPAEQEISSRSADGTTVVARP